MERGAHPLTHIGVWDCRNMGSGPRSATKLIANGMAPLNLESRLDHDWIIVIITDVIIT